MAGPQKVGEAYYEFSAKGLEALKLAAQQMGQQFAAAGQAAAAAGQGMAQSFAGAGQAIGNNLNAQGLAAFAAQMRDLVPMGERVRAVVVAAFNQGGEAVRRMGAAARAVGGELGAAALHAIALEKAERQALTASEAAAKAAAQRMANFRGLAAGIQGTFGSMTTMAFGWVKAGFQASAAGQVWGFQMEELHRQIASLFVPQIQALIKYTGQLVRWFQGLTGEQQKKIRQWAILVGGMTAAAVILPKLVAGLQALGMAFKGAHAALLLMSANPLVLIAAAVAALLLLTADWKALLKDVGETFGSVERAGKKATDSILDGLKGIAGVIKQLLDETGKWVEKLMEGAGLAGKKETRMSGSQAFLASLFGPPKQFLERPKDEGSPQRRIFNRLVNVNNPMLSPFFGAFGNVGDLFQQVKEGTTKRQELVPQLGGIEDIQATWRRIAESSIKATAGVQPVEEVVDEIRSLIRERLAPAADAARNQPPPIVR